MSAISIATLGMFDGPRNYRAGSVMVQKKDEQVPKPNIFVKDVEFKKSLYNIHEDFIVVKSVK